LWPEKKVISACYGDSLARDWGRAVRDEFMMNPELFTRIRHDSASVTNWQTTDGGGMRTAGVGGPLVGSGAQLCVIDDPHKNWEDAMSTEKRKRLIDWFNSTLYTRLEPGASLIVVQTRWCKGDLTGYLTEEHDDDWKHISLPALAEEGDMLGRQEGEALCPERFTKEDLEGIKAGIGSMMFAGLYQQRPAPAEGGIIKRGWWQRFSTPPLDFDRVLMSWDMTFKKTGSSWVVGQVWGRKGPNAYLLDQVRDKLDFPSTLMAVRRLSEKWPEAKEKLIEDAANGPAVISVLRKELPCVLAVPPRGSKESRLTAIAPLVEAGNVYLPTVDLAPWIDDFIEEISMFPNGANDDMADSAAQALARLFDSRKPVLAPFNLGGSGERPSPWQM
jgi:predicted phage terminase large subunit-like protein